MKGSLITDHLKSKHLVRIANGDLIAVMVKSFISKDLAKTISKRLTSNGYDHYLNAPSIGRIGMAFYETEGQERLVSRYFEVAEKNIDKLRTSCLPFASPIDILRCKLDEIWPAGACIERLYGRTMFVGLSRVVKPNVRFMVHHDIFEKDAPDSYRAASLVSQFACNIYLDMPEVGGALQLWSKELSPKTFDDMRGDSYGIDPTLLGEPDVVIKPEAGDLIIFNSRKMHGVSPSKDSARISLSCFIGFRGEHAPLSYWS